MALYQSIIRDDVQLPEGFLHEHAPSISTKLKDAAGKLGQPDGKDNAVNQCLHLATSVVVRNIRNLDEKLDKLRRTEGMETIDPEAVLTVAVLYHLLALQPKEAWVQQLLDCFNDINWLLSRDAMRLLGFTD